jgi:hypothetical protein
MAARETGSSMKCIVGLSRDPKTFLGLADGLDLSVSHPAVHMTDRSYAIRPDLTIFL